MILPRANEKDIDELPDNIKKAMKMHFVDSDGRGAGAGAGASAAGGDAG